MDSINALISKNEYVRSYIFWTSILVIKMLFMSVLTGLTRFRTKTFANPEDLPSKKLKIKFDDPDVERVRRAHRNDLENILPLIAAAFLYAFTNPDTFIAVNIFRIAVISRIIHTIVYCVIIVPQPARAIAFFVPFIITAYMAVQTIIHFW